VRVIPLIANEENSCLKHNSLAKHSPEPRGVTEGLSRCSQTMYPISQLFTRIMQHIRV
jgi:hypothetical protein